MNKQKDFHSGHQIKPVAVQGPVLFGSLEVIHQGSFWQWWETGFLKWFAGWTECNQHFGRSGLKGVQVYFLVMWLTEYGLSPVSCWPMTFRSVTGLHTLKTLQIHDCFPWFVSVIMMLCGDNYFWYHGGISHCNWTKLMARLISNTMSRFITHEQNPTTHSQTHRTQQQTTDFYIKVNVSHLRCTAWLDRCQLGGQMDLSEQFKHEPAD